MDIEIPTTHMHGGDIVTSVEPHREMPRHPVINPEDASNQTTMPRNISRIDKPIRAITLPPQPHYARER
jgi:hypothetical protein